jgi:hypothetical protein
MTQGTVSNWYVVIPGHMVADLYFLAAPMLKRLNDYPLFLFANYCDEVLFGIGTILLACELYETSWAVFFAATTAVFSTIWLHEIWWNFRLYCWLPFAFCFFLRFIKTGAWRWFLLFCLLAPLSFFAALPYFISPLSFFIFFFCLLTAAASRPELEAGLVASCRKSGLAVPVLKGLGSAALAGALLGLLWLCLRGLGAEDIVLSFFGRDAAGSVARNVFFTYGGNTGWIKFAELLTAVPNSLDQTYYCGLATVVFALLHLRYWEEGEPIRRQSHVFLALIALTASFSCGGLAAELAYRFWPTMKLFRHIGLTGGVTKLLLIFYAAYGVDVFAKRAAAGGAAFLGDLRALLAAFLSVLLLKALLMWLTHSYSTDLAGRLSQAMSSWGLAAAAALWIPAVFAGAIWCGRGGRRAAGLAALFVVTVLQLADVVSYRAVQDSVLAPAGGGGVVDTFRFFDYPYSPARSQKYFTNARFAALDAAARRATDDPDGAADPIVASPDGDAAYDSLRAWPFGAVYWSWESFFYFDACRSIFRVDSRLASVEDFDSVYDEKRKTTYFETRLPRRPAFLKILGCGYPKLQVFKRLHVVPDAAALRSALGSPRYKGDVLFSAGAPPSRAATSVAAPDAALLGADERVDAKIDVRSFAANGIKLAVDNPLSSPAILFYSDAWHKNWRARVDGAPAPIAAANFGFKAVEIPAGRSEVEFSYRPALVKAILRLFVGFNAVMALVLFGLVLAPPFARGSARRPGPAGRNC